MTFGAAREHCIADEFAIKASLDHMGAHAAHASSEETNRLVIYKKKPGRGSNGSKSTRVAPDLGLVDVGPCRCCGGKHSSEVCKFRYATCYGCNKTGHLRSVCRSVKGGKVNSYSRVHSVQSDSLDMPRARPTDEMCKGVENVESDDTVEFSEAAFGLYNVKSKCNSTTMPYKVQVKIRDKTLIMELDTGASRM